MAQCPAVNPATSSRCTLQVATDHDGKVRSQHEVWAQRTPQPKTHPPSTPAGATVPMLVERWSA